MPAPAEPHRILIVAVDNLGDLVFASALTPPMREAFPNATIDVWSKTYTSEVARLIPHVHDVIACDPFWAVAPHLAHLPRPSVRAVVRTVLEIRHRQYDVAVLSGAPWRTAAAVAATGIPMRIGLGRRSNQRFLTHALASEDRTQPVLREHARLLEPLGIHSTNHRYRLEAERLGEAREAVAGLLPRRFVTLHPFAGSRGRCVPLAEWAQAAMYFHSHGLPALWIGLPRELDDLRRSYTHPVGFYSDRLGDGSLASVAAALSLASVFIGHDSGPLHVAGAFGVPVVGVFAPGEPQRTFPQGVGPSRIIARAAAREITARMLIHDAEALGVFSSA